MSAGDAVVLVVFGTWLSATLLAQVRRAGFQVVRAADLFSLLPRYNFFAPEPIMRDYELEYRDFLPGMRPGPWRPFPVTESRRWWHMFWNPNRREKKAFFVAVGQLLAVYLESAHRTSAPAGRARASVLLSTPYILILRAVENRPHPEAVAAQFRCLEVRTRGTYAVRREVFVSAVHRLDPAEEES
ncbi:MULTISPECIES: hypothetical protein [Streptomyces]|uniref:Uncharacterized protein n=1 Tax=Streptomyces dengpaensis TaxID=2049881 RepID=A0ABM6SMG3_9ACTN|nr:MULTISPECIES: hypothetical protein [Streptomyces]AVH55865.1 hypothetical protein C4B68_08875 [Streptomyces dengpaensis]PIB12116.1 hypothetical protein B1C81_02810 [Streptomyces sp. HG99]